MLLKVVTDILNPEFKVSDIYNREKRKQYIDNFDKSQKPDLSNEASEQWSVQDIENNKEQASRNSEKQEIKGDKKRKTRNRGALVPKSLNLHISASVGVSKTAQAIFFNSEIALGFSFCYF